MTHRPFLSLPLRSMQPFCLREDSSLFSVASETLSLFAKISLVIDRFCFMAERTACCRLLTGSVAGSFWIRSVNFTCMSSGCSNNSGLTQCFSFHALRIRGKPDSKFFAIADHAKHILHALIASFRLAALVNLLNGQLQEARVGQHEAVIIFFDP